jgi:hypothetical protein
MMNCNLLFTPMESNVKWSKYDNPQDSQTQCKFLGSSGGQPNVYNNVHLSKLLMHNVYFGIIFFQLWGSTLAIAKHILHYIKSILSLGIQ